MTPPRSDDQPIAQPNAWKPEWVAALRELVAERFSNGVMADKLTARFGREFTPNMVAGRVARLGLKRAGAATSVTKHSMRGEKKGPARRRAAPVFDLPDEGQDMPEQPGVGILDLTHDMCRWPIDPVHRLCSWSYCGAPRDKRSVRSPYCTEHWGRSRGALPRFKRRAKGAADAKPLP